MTGKDLKEFAERITYKPDYSLQWERDPRLNFITLKFSTMRPSSDKSGHIIPIVNFNSFPNYDLTRLPKEIFIKEVEKVLIAFEIHEVHEWLKFDGRHVTEPHPETKVIECHLL